MKTYHFIALSVLALGIVLLKKSKKRNSRPIIKGIAINPTAIFIWQSSSKWPTIDFYHHYYKDIQKRR